MSKKRILEQILPVSIIREVEKWPVLYTRDCPEMPNIHFKNKVWNEIAKALIEDWDSYSTAEKECKIMDLMKKWRNLRDTFKRQILVEKKRRQGHNVKKRKYVYFKHMSFLLPYMKDGSAGAGDEASEDAPAPAPAPRRDFEHIDEDRHFLMSLLPSFRRMNDDEKLTAKMDILKVIKEVRSQSAAAMDTYVCQLQLGDDDDPPLVVKKELFPNERDYRSTSECSGQSCDNGDTD